MRGPRQRGTDARPVRRARAWAAWAAAGGVVLAAGPARAESPCASSTSACVNSDTLWTAPGPSRFVGVAGTQTVAASELAVGLLTSYQSRPVVLRAASPGPGGTSTASAAVEHQVTATFLWQYGVTSRLAIDAALPITLGQTGAALSALTSGADLKFTAMRDLRFGLALALIPRERVSYAASRERQGIGHSYAATLRLGMTAPIGDKGELASERTAVFTPSLAADYRVGPVSIGTELGARIRPTTSAFGTRVGSQLAGGVGVGVELAPRELLTAQIEARALYNFPEQADVTRGPAGLTSTPNGRFLVPAEWMLSVRSAPAAAGDFALVLGGGGGLSSDTVTVPRLRFVLGVQYAPEGRDSDGDGVPDRLDKCPGAPQRGTPRDGCDHGGSPATSPEEDAR